MPKDVVFMSDPVERARELHELIPKPPPGGQYVGIEPDRCSCGEDFKSRMSFLNHRAAALADRCEAQEREIGRLAAEVERLRGIEAKAQLVMAVRPDRGGMCTWACVYCELECALATDEKGEG